MVMDLCNKISFMRKWGPNNLHNTLRLTIPDPEYVKELVSIAPAKPMTVNISTISLGHGNVIIDEICVKMYLNCPELIQQHVVSAPHMIHAALNRLQGKRKQCLGEKKLSLTKLIVTGRPNDIQIVLGRLIDTESSS